MVRVPFSRHDGRRWRPTPTAYRGIAAGYGMAATPLSAIKSLGEDGATVKCSFCGKRRHQASGLAGAAGGAICTECLALCHEIITEELA